MYRGVRTVDPTGIGRAGLYFSFLINGHAAGVGILIAYRPRHLCSVGNPAVHNRRLQCLRLPVVSYRSVLDGNLRLRLTDHHLTFTCIFLQIPGCRNLTFIVYSPASAGGITPS